MSALFAWASPRDDPPRASVVSVGQQRAACGVFARSAGRSMRSRPADGLTRLARPRISTVAWTTRTVG